jgi:cytochrome d ubiquinol oxidase subunit II
VVAVLAGGAILFPSLALLFGLVLQGRFDPTAPVVAPDADAPNGTKVVAVSRPGLLARSAGACAIAGIGLLTVADAPWAHAIGIVCLFAFIVLGFGALRPTEIAAVAPDEHAT